MSPTNIYDEYAIEFPSAWPHEHDWIYVHDGQLAKPGAIAGLLSRYIDDQQVIVLIHSRRVGSILPKAQATTFIERHIGDGDIQVSDPELTSFVTISGVGVATGWQQRPPAQANQDTATKGKVMRSDLRILIPVDKHDVNKVKAIAEMGYPGIEPVLPVLLGWIQDVNWPVARELAPFLATIGAPLAPHCRQIFATDDDTWKYNVIEQIVAPSPALRNILRPELERLAAQPTAGERIEEVDIVAQDALKRS